MFWIAPEWRIFKTFPTKLFHHGWRKFWISGFWNALEWRIIKTFPQNIFLALSLRASAREAVWACLCARDGDVGGGYARDFKILRTRARKFKPVRGRSSAILPSFPEWYVATTWYYQNLFRFISSSNYRSLKHQNFTFPQRKTKQALSILNVRNEQGICNTHSWNTFATTTQFCKSHEVDKRQKVELTAESVGMHNSTAINYW